MIFVSVHAFNPQRRVFLHRGVEDFLEFAQDVGFQELSSVLGAPDDVVLVLVRAVAEVLNPHETSVARRTCDVYGSIPPRPQGG